MIYLDTNIYLDYLEDRRDNLKPLGEFAFQLLNRAIQCEFKIILSDMVLKELEKYISMDKIKIILNPLNRKRKILSVGSDYNSRKEAIKLKKRYKIPYADALHYILAINKGAQILVTNDKHFSLICNSKIKILPANEL